MTLQFRRGPSEDVPASAALGEPIYVTDTGILYIGTETGIRRIGPVTAEDLEGLDFTPVESIDDVPGLTAALANKSDVGHTHDYSELTGTPDIGATALTDLTDWPSGAPSQDQILKFDGNQWVFAADLTGDANSGGDAQTLNQQPGSHYLNRANHTGQQATSTISGFDAAAASAAPVQTVAGKTGSVTLTKADVGLDNVDNTSDAQKPVSALMQDELDLKADVSSLAQVAESGSYTDLSDKPTINDILPSPGDAQSSATIAWSVANQQWEISQGGTSTNATQLLIDTQPVGGASGGQLQTQPVIRVADASGNTVASDNTTVVTVDIQSGIDGSLIGLKTATASNGVATFSGLSLSGTVGVNYVLRFTASGLASVDSANVSVTPGAASIATSTVSANPTTLDADGSSTSVLTVQLKDANGNDLTASGGAVDFQSPSSGSIGSVTDNTDGTYTATYTAGSSAGSVTIYAIGPTNQVIADTASITLNAVAAGQFEFRGLFSVAQNPFGSPGSPFEATDILPNASDLFDAPGGARYDSQIAVEWTNGSAESRYPFFAYRWTGDPSSAPSWTPQFYNPFFNTIPLTGIVDVGVQSIDLGSGTHDYHVYRLADVTQDPQSTINYLVD